MLSIRRLGVLVACAGVLAASIALPATGTAQVANLPSRACDAWFNIGGRFSSIGNDLRFALVNRSTSKPCVATRVMLMFAYPAKSDDVRPSAPAGWHADPVRCSGGGAVCGIVWTGSGVAPGLSLEGFGLVTPPTVQASVWIIEVGGQWVALQIGTVRG